MEMHWISLSLLEWGIVTALSVLFLVQLFYLFFYHRFYRYAVKDTRHKKNPEAFPPVSIILTAHNEAELLRDHLPRLMKQEYPQFEVIVVNNTSSDDTEEILALLKQQYPNLHSTFVPLSSRNPSNKKLALSMGIKASQYEWMVFTEPGCFPQSPYWLQSMARNFSSKTGIVLGYNCIQKGKGYFATKIRLLNYLSQLRFLTSALSGHPFMGYGRNLAYRKSMFFRKRGFSGYLNLKRGEDDLFLNRVTTPHNTRVELTPESLTIFSPRPTPRQWKYEQHERRKTYRLLRGSQPFFWSLETGSRFLFLIAANGAFLYGLLWGKWLIAGVAFFLLMCRFLLLVWVTKRNCRALQEPLFKASLLFLSWIQLCHCLSNYKIKTEKLN